MKLLNILKKDTGYLSWEEYKKRLVELHVLYLVNKLSKDTINYGYNDAEKMTRSEIARLRNI